MLVIFVLTVVPCLSLHWVFKRQTINFFAISNPNLKNGKRFLLFYVRKIVFSLFPSVFIGLENTMFPDTIPPVLIIDEPCFRESTVCQHRIVCLGWASQVHQPARQKECSTDFQPQLETANRKQFYRRGRYDNKKFFPCHLRCPFVYDGSDVGNCLELGSAVVAVFEFDLVAVWCARELFCTAYRVKQSLTRSFAFPHTCRKQLETLHVKVPLNFTFPYFEWTEALVTADRSSRSV